MVTLATVSAALISAVWIFHGLYSKLLNGIPRHRMIIRRILGERVSGIAVIAIGIFEIALGVWAFTGWERIACAVIQTLVIAVMNALEILLARELLISAIGMLVLNAGFLAVVWWWAVAAGAR